MTDWRDQAACRGQHELFFNPAHETLAKAVCATCPVQAECLADAYQTDDRDLIRGGLRPDERPLPARKTGPKPSPCGTEQGYKRHIRAGNPTCQPCRDAHALYWREQLARNPAAREARLAKKRAAYQADPDAERARCRDWYRRNVAQTREEGAA